MRSCSDTEARSTADRNDGRGAKSPMSTFRFRIEMALFATVFAAIAGSAWSLEPRLWPAVALSSCASLVCVVLGVSLPRVLGRRD